MASNNFAESVINGTYKKSKQKQQNTSQSSNAFAESVIDGSYKKSKTINVSREPTTTPQTQTINTINDTIIKTMGKSPTQQTSVANQTQPSTTPLVDNRASINPNASDNEKLRISANNNYNQKLALYEQASQAYKQKRDEELANRGISSDYISKFEDATPEQRLAKPTKEQVEQSAEDARKYQAQREAIDEATKTEMDNAKFAQNQLKYAKYLKDYSDVQNEGVSLYDQTLGHVVRGAQDIFSTWTDDNRYIDENGNAQYLPTYNQMKEEQARNNTLLGNIGLDGLGKFLGDVGYQGAKVATSMGLNALIPYAGSATYFTDIYADSYKDNINSGMDNEGAMVNAFAKAGQNYIKQRLLGGFGGKLAKVTGKDVSSLEKVFSKQWAKVATSPKVVAALSSMSAEAIDEATDTYVEKAIDAITRNDVSIGDVFSPDTFLEALYSGAVGGATGAIGGVNPNSMATAQNAINERLANQNIEQNTDTQIQTETPQIQQNTPENINNQPTLEQAQLELNEADNNVQNNETKETEKQQQKDIEQDLINEINNEQRKLNNGTSEDDGYHLAELQKELQEVQQKSIASDSNAFNLGKIDENNKQQINQIEPNTETNGLNTKEYNEIKRRYKDLMETIGFEEDYNANATPSEIIGQLKSIKETAYEGDGFLETARMESPEILKQTKSQYDKINRLIDRFENKLKQEQPTQNDNIPETKSDDVLKVAEQEPVKVDLGGKDINDSKINKALNKLQGNKDRYIALDNGDNIRNTVQEEFNNRNEYLNDKINEIVKKELTPQQEEQHFIDNGVDKKVAKISSEMPKPDKVSLSDKIKNGKATLREEWAQFKRAFVDKGDTIYNLGKKLKNKVLYPMYDKIGTTRGEANYSIEKGQTDLSGNKFNNFTDKNGKKVSMSLNQIWDGVNPELANEYLAHWLNVDRYNQITQDGQQKYVFGTPDITPEISQARIAELEKSNPELKRFGENVWQYGRNMLQNMVDSGLVNEQQAQQFMQETPHYVRLQRNVDTNNQTALEIDKTGKVAVNKPTKHEFKGSDIDILPFKNSMADYTFEVAKAIRTNLFAQELAKAMSVSSTDDNVTSLDDSFGIRPDLLQDNGDGTYSLTLFNNGVATIIPINNGIYESLTPNKHYKFEDRLPFKAIRKVDNFRKALLTDKNPMFLATNMMKDLFDAPLNSKYPVAFAKNYPRAIKEVTTNGKYYQQYQALGGLQNSYFEKGEFKKDGSKINPLTWIERGNNAIEQLPRLAEFISTMEKTGDVNQAMYNAAEITTNFKRGGDVTKAANRNGVTFLNASVQGFSKQIRNFTDIQSPKQAVQLLGKIAVLGVAPALINDAMYGDDEEYKEMQDYIKDRYYLFKGLNGQWIRIPKGRALSVFQSAARRTGYALDGDKNAFKDFVNFASTQVAPNNPFENNIISPFVDVARNESWSGSKIVSDSLAKRPEAEQFNEKTDNFSKWLGGILNYSPMKINYLLDQYSGGVGDFLLPTITPKATGQSSNPLEQAFASKFTADPIYSNKNVGVFYDTMNELEKKKYSIKANETDKLKYSYIYSQNQKMAELKKEQSNIQSDSSLSNKEKYDKARDIQKEINELAKKSVQDLDNIEDNTYYAKVGDNIYYLDADGTFKKDGYAESHQKSADKKGMALYDYYKEQYEKRKEKSK